ncbi:hypothetical protein STEG23_010019 [Scotinomys teguina]
MVLTFGPKAAPTCTGSGTQIFFFRVDQYKLVKAMNAESRERVRVCEYRHRCTTVCTRRSEDDLGSDFLYLASSSFFHMTADVRTPFLSEADIQLHPNATVYPLITSEDSLIPQLHIPLFSMITMIQPITAAIIPNTPASLLLTRVCHRAQESCGNRAQTML